MIEFLFVAGQWLVLFIFVYCACLVITCAAKEIRNGPVGPTTTRDWDAHDRTLEKRQRNERLTLAA